MILQYTCYIPEILTIDELNVTNPVQAGAAPACSAPAWMAGIGPSGVRALPLAAGIHVGGHYKWQFLVRAECVRCPWLLA